MTTATDLAGAVLRLARHQAALYPADRELELLTETLDEISERVTAMEHSVGPDVAPIDLAAELERYGFGMLEIDGRLQ